MHIALHRLTDLNTLALQELQTKLELSESKRETLSDILCRKRVTSARRLSNALKSPCKTSPNACVPLGMAQVLLCNVVHLNFFVVQVSADATREMVSITLTLELMVYSRR